MSVYFRLVVTWERVGLLAFLYVVFSCAFVTFPCRVQGQVCYLIVSISDLRLLYYFKAANCNNTADHSNYVSKNNMMFTKNLQAD